MPELEPTAYIAIFVALALGGVLKGATGMGSPVVAVPVMASFFDVRLAVVLMVLPNLMTNLWQLWQFRSDHMKGSFAWVFALAGAAGAVAGTFLLANLPMAVLMNMVAFAVIAYIALRLVKPDFAISLPLAGRVAPLMGLLAGALQGAAGISAPVSVSFLNAMRLERAVFIPTISMFFVAMCVVQVPVQVSLGLMTGDLALLSLFAVLPLVAGMPVGAWLARSISARNFDRVTLLFLTGLALKLIADALLG